MTTPSIWEREFFSAISTIFVAIVSFIKMTSLGQFFGFLKNSLFKNIYKAFNVLYSRNPGFTWRMVLFGCIFASIFIYLIFIL